MCVSVSVGVNAALLAHWFIKQTRQTVCLCVCVWQCEALAKGRSCRGLMEIGGKTLVGKIKMVGDPSIFDPNSDDVI